MPFIGDPLHKETKIGPLVSVTHRDQVEAYVELAKTEGGDIIFGGKRPVKMIDDGAFYEPTIITGLPYTARCASVCCIICCVCYVID